MDLAPRACHPFNLIWDTDEHHPSDTFLRIYSCQQDLFFEVFIKKGHPALQRLKREIQ